MCTESKIWQIFARVSLPCSSSVRLKEKARKDGTRAFAGGRLDFDAVAKVAKEDVARVFALPYADDVKIVDAGMPTHMSESGGSCASARRGPLGSRPSRAAASPSNAHLHFKNEVLGAPVDWASGVWGKPANNFGR